MWKEGIGPAEQDRPVIPATLRTVHVARAVAFVVVSTALGCGWIQVNGKPLGAPSAGGEERAASDPAPVAAHEQAAPAKATGVVEDDLEDAGSFFDLRAIENAFERMPVSSYKVTTAPVRASDLVRPDRDLGWTAKDSFSVRWRRCGRGQSSVCFEFFAPEKRPPLPVGTVGLVWRSAGDGAYFVSMDGGVYRVKNSDLAPYQPGTPPAPPLVHVGFGLDDLREYAAGGEFGQEHLERLSQTREEMQKCVEPHDKKWKAATDKVARQNLLPDAKRARYRQVNERFEKQITKACQKHLDKALEQLHQAFEDRSARRKALYDKVRARL